MFRFRKIAVLFFAAAVGFAQQTAALRGKVSEESGGVIPNARVTVSGHGIAKHARAGGDGEYSFAGLPPGAYTLTASWQGFETFEDRGVVIEAGQTLTVDVPLRLKSTHEEVTVRDEAEGLSVADPSSNASALVLSGASLDALPDDPDDLLSDLKALAGPTIGADGAQILIDGFSGAHLPPKDSIREVRINQNPFSAEYDQVGLGRIEIFTKPGWDKLRGLLSFKDSDAAFNSRNPYAPDKPNYQSRQDYGELSGGLKKRASFFLSFERQDIDDNAVILSQVLNAQLQPTPFTAALVTPQRWMSVAPRVDIQLSGNQSLTLRYDWTTSGQNNAGMGKFALPSQAYANNTYDHTIQATETAVLGSHAVNETRFQYDRSQQAALGGIASPTLSVLGAFVGGGDSMGNVVTNASQFELQNYTSIIFGSQTVKFGGRVRGGWIDENSTQGFNGNFTFSGGSAPVLDANGNPVLGAGGQPLTESITSLERYRRTLYFSQLGFSPGSIRALGGGADQFSVTAGNPNFSTSQADAGLFIQDDWRVRPTFTVSAGLRYEMQTNLRDYADFAPRLGLAWAPGSRHGKTAKTVFRAGAGLFYDRFSETLALQAAQFNGVNQRQYIVSNPNFFPTVPPMTQIAGMHLSPALQQMDAHLRAPYVFQTSLGVERQLPFKLVVSSTVNLMRGVHLLRSRDINAPLPGTYPAGSPQLGTRPYPGGDIFSYESAGLLKESLWITNVSRRMSSRLNIFGWYAYGHAQSDTDGPGFFPANQYNVHPEFGRAAIDIRHRMVVGGSIAAPLGFMLSPFLVARSGAPFNITTGNDVYGSTLFNARPAFAGGVSQPGVLTTAFGAFNPNPGANAVLIPRNYGQGPGYFAVNLRLSRTFGFGGEKSAHSAKVKKSKDNGVGLMTSAPGGAQESYHDSAAGARYTLTFAVIARNLLNSVNPGIPVGSLASPLFGQSNWLASGYNPNNAAEGDNRRIQFQIRFGF